MAAVVENAAAKANGTSNRLPKSQRFSHIPATLDIPIRDQIDESVEIDLEELADDPTELCSLFEAEEAARTYWMTVALAYANQKKIDFAIDVLNRGIHAMQNQPKDKISLVACLCWMYLGKSRDAPRLAPEGKLVSEAKTKDYFLQEATKTLNEASRINPSYPPLFLARGVLYLLRASLQIPSKAIGNGPLAVDAEKVKLLKSALKAFEDAHKASQGKNTLAILGKSRALFSLGRYADALAGYQDVLRCAPDLIDPDPRIGIGCCFWQLGFKDDAKLAWERSLEIRPDQKLATILLGLYYLDASGHVPTNSSEFLRLYKKAIQEYTVKSYKLDKNMALACTSLGNFYLSKKSWAQVDQLARRAIDNTDVNAIASDGWYLLARKEHYNGDADRASDYYRRADDARGGPDRGYMPAKFGVAQLSVLKNDLAEAKLRLEKMAQQPKNYEARVLLGTLYAEEVFATYTSALRDDKLAEATKAINLLEQVRAAWKDCQRNVAPDASVLLNLARLYELEQPEKALECLRQVEELEISQVEAEIPVAEGEDAAAARLAALRKYLPPQLLNNIGCFHSNGGHHVQASAMFEAALTACVRIGENKDGIDTDALVTTISFNLGRSYESRNMIERAVEVYEGLLKRHEDYIDARTRLAYIKLRKLQTKDAPDEVAKLYADNPADLEVRALYGWFLNKKLASKKRPFNIQEDSELRHYKHTLQNYNKHDRYALVGMGNMFLMSAREMPRGNEQDKQKRSATYTKAVEFFDKALLLDPKNAYAAQGIAIALAEDKKDLKNALQIFLKVRDSVKEPLVYINLGHTYAELRQFSKAIESYEIALSKEGKANDASILTCLGRTWLNKGRSERNLDAFKMALDFANKALAAVPESLHFKFNVAFVQIQLAMTLNSLSESQRNSFQLQDAAEGLEEAIKALDEIASSNTPPYPKHDIEQRANMARNTQRKQLERAIASQKEYEAKHKEKLTAALEQRQAELRRREEEKRKAEEAERERQEKIRKKREGIAARDRALAEQRAEEERARQDAEMTTDSETGNKVKRKRKPAVRKEGAEAGEAGSKRKSRSRKKKSAASGDDDDVEDRPQKKQRLSSKKDVTKKNYKSQEIIVDSDEEDGAGADRAGSSRVTMSPAPFSDEELVPLEADDDDAPAADKMNVESSNNHDEDEDEKATVARRQRARPQRGRVVDESDEEEDEEIVAVEDTGASLSVAKDDAGGDKNDDLSPPPVDVSMMEAEGVRVDA